jgi:hypothetical protein
LKLVSPTEHDVRLLRDISMRKVVPAWAKACERIHPDCPQEWRQQFAKVLPEQYAGKSRP